MIKKSVYTIISVFLITASLSVFSSCTKKLEEKSTDYIFEITVIKTGKSDAILLESQNHTVLIDTADRDSGRKITRLLKDKGKEILDCIIITHFDDDHIGGFETVADRIKIRNVIQPVYLAESEAYGKYNAALKEKNINVITAQKNISFHIDDLFFKIYTSKTDYENKNNCSLITSVIHGSNSFLFAGDIETERCMEFIQNDFDKYHAEEYDFLKVPHHGIYFEGAEEFYSTLIPKITVITDNEEINTEETQKILYNLKSNVYHTKDGEVKIISDGKKVKAVQN